VGDAVGCFVGVFVGASVGTSVGESVGESVGDSVGDVVIRSHVWHDATPGVHMYPCLHEHVYVIAVVVLPSLSHTPFVASHGF
jgi:hypothetical protein